MFSDQIAIGLVFHGFITVVVATVAFILVYQLLKKGKRAFASYAIFWLLTGLLWAQNAVRNVGIGLVGEVFPRELSAVLSQSTVFFTGVPLLYYVGIKVFKNITVARVLALQAVVAGAFGIWFLAQPNGVLLEPITFFTAEAVANVISSTIFRVEIGAIALLLLFDIFRRRKDYNPDGHNHEILYSLAILLYVGLGGIDLAKMVTDWTLVIFRLGYCAVFMMVYVLVRHEDENDDDYMITLPENRHG